MKDAAWFVYVVECFDKKLYVGIAQDVDGRIKLHNRGYACRFTKYRNPVVLLYKEKHQTKSEARIREIELKGFSRKKKFAVIKEGSSG